MNPASSWPLLRLGMYQSDNAWQACMPLTKSGAGSGHRAIRSLVTWSCLASHSLCWVHNARVCVEPTPSSSILPLFCHLRSVSVRTIKRLCTTSTRAVSAVVCLLHRISRWHHLGIHQPRYLYSRLQLNRAQSWKRSLQSKGACSSASEPR
jgi:hypothetical protein